MWSEHFRHLASKSPLLLFPLASLAIFVTLFAIVIVWVARRGASLEDHGLLPLERDRHE
jgi:hypothetical protein